MTAPDTARIRELAKAATPGPYGFDDKEHGQINGWLEPDEFRGIANFFGAYSDWSANSEYFAALDPATVLALCDAADRCAEAERTVERLSAAGDKANKAYNLAAERADRLAEGLKPLVEEFGCSIERYDRNGPDWTHKDGTEVFDVSVILDRREFIERARSLLSEHEEARKGEEVGRG